METKKLNISMRFILKIPISLFFLFIYSCDNTPEKESEKSNSQEKVYIQVPKFNQDSAYAYIKKQVDYGPRFISSKGWENCFLWLEKKLSNYADTVIINSAKVTTYDGKIHRLKNIVASFSPNKKNRVALFAHWDTRHIADYDTINKDMPILGANDGGSGVGVLLECARQFKINQPNIGVDIILFDAEDYGDPNSNDPTSWCLGSQHWAKNPHQKNYKARYGVLLDMVGGKDATFYQEGYSVKYADNIVQKFWRKANNLGYSKYFKNKLGWKLGYLTDDHVFVNEITLNKGRHIRTINIIEYDINNEQKFNKHWHTHQDNMLNIDKKTLKVVGQTLLEILYYE